MKNEELKVYLEEKRKNGLDQIGCWQLKIAANMGLSEEKLEWIASPGLSFTNREYVYLAFMMRVPPEKLEELPELTANGIFKKIEEKIVEDVMKHSQILEIMESQQKILLEEMKESKQRYASIEKQLLELKEEKSRNESLCVPQKKYPRWGRRGERKKQEQENREFLLLLQEKRFTEGQREFLLHCREMGDSMELIRNLAHENFDREIMQRIRRILVETPRISKKNEKRLEKERNTSMNQKPVKIAERIRESFGVVEETGIVSEEELTDQEEVTEWREPMKS